MFEIKTCFFLSNFFCALLHKRLLLSNIYESNINLKLKEMKTGD